MRQAAGRRPSRASTLRALFRFPRAAALLRRCLLPALLAPGRVLAQDPEPIQELREVLAAEAAVASLQPEPLLETPVITTVITREQIRRMGARTLNEVLLTVPGFSRIQDHNEYFSVLRGVYGSSQQKILVLRDGHRLNSRSYSQANFGPGLALNNIRRIEVMRGPASALYGDVATTGVINIVTKEGRQIGGGKVTLGAGSHGQVKAEYLYGRDLGNGREIAAHASGYRSSGEKRSVGPGADYAPFPSAGTVVLDRFGSSWPGHDVGLKYKLRDLTFSVSRRYEHYTHPRASAAGYGQLIDHWSYRDFNGQGVGASFDTVHTELNYSPRLGESFLTVRPYFDTLETLGVEPSRRTGEPGAAATSPASSVIGWKDRSYGLQAYLRRPYAGRGGSSSWLAGAQVERVEVYGSFDLLSPDATNAQWRRRDADTLPAGKETSYALFAQAKHRLLEPLLFNAGVRYDYKARALYAQTIDRVSPRAAFIYLPAPDLGFRLSFGRSFADPPYFYRYNTLSAAGYQGSDQLRPETLDSTQFSVEWTAPWRVEHRLNLFANDYRDVFFRDVDGFYKNTGLVRTRGLELELGHKRPRLSARANYTFLYTFKDSVGYQVQDHGIANVPSHMGNLILDWAPLDPSRGGWAEGLWLHYSLRAVGRQFAPVGVSQPAALPADFAGRNRTHVASGYAISNLGLNLENFLPRGLLGANNLSFRFHVYNLFDARYTQGGSVNLPYEQPGRWFLAQLSYAWF